MKTVLLQCIYTFQQTIKMSSTSLSTQFMDFRHYLTANILTGPSYFYFANPIHHYLLEPIREQTLLTSIESTTGY